MKEYYGNKKIVEELKKKQRPSRDDVCSLRQTIEDDRELTLAFYKDNENENWLGLLKAAGQFEDVEQAIVGDGGKIHRVWAQSEYLAGVAGKKPEEVLDIIKKFDTDNTFVIRDCLKALQAMPVVNAIEGMELVRRLLAKEERLDWHWVGEEAAKLMVSFAKGGYKDEAFELAGVLLEVHPKEDKFFERWDNLKGRVLDYQYSELMSKYYKRLWEVDGIWAGKQLVDMLEEQIEIEEQRRSKEGEEKKFDCTENSYIMMPKIEDVEKERADIANVIVSGIRQMGEYLMESDAVKGEELLTYLEGKGRGIFKRITIHLLRFAPKEEKWNERISKIIGNVKENNRSNTENEYKNLLHDKYEELSEEARNAYLGWVEEQGKFKEDNYKQWYLERHNKEATKEDIEEQRNYLKARELYCIRDKEGELYEEYLRQSGRGEKEVEPRPRGMEVYAPGALKYSPLSKEEMGEKKAEEVIEYILAYDDKDEDEEERFEEWHEVDRKEALAGVFKEDIANRAAEYLAVENDLAGNLPGRYLRNYFYAIHESIQNKRVEKPDWGKIIELCNLVFAKRAKDKKYESVMLAVIDVIGDGIKGELYKDEFEEDSLKIIWEVLEKLVDYSYEEEEEEDDRSDPLQTCINRVRGKALQNIVRFGLFCKNNREELFGAEYQKKLTGKLEYVLEKIDKLWVLCVFGVFFGNICWLDETWTRENIDRIFDEKNDKRWWATWGSYMVWARPSKQSFEIAKEKYVEAIKLMGQKDPYQDRKDIREGLVEHVMTAFWQGWTDYEKDGILPKLLEKAEVDLRAMAVDYLGEGFGYLKEAEEGWKNEVAGRLGDYWRERLEAIKKKPEENMEEAAGFTSWLKDAPFEPGFTIEMLEATMEITGGRIGERRGVLDFFAGISELAKHDMLKSMQLLNKAVGQAKGKMDFLIHAEDLKDLMDTIQDLPENPERKAIWKEAVKLADAYGRMGEDKFKRHYDAISEKLKIENQIVGGKE